MTEIVPLAGVFPVPALQDSPLRLSITG